MRRQATAFANYETSVSRHIQFIDFHAPLTLQPLTSMSAIDIAHAVVSGM
jgi:hypothetical protein